MQVKMDADPTNRPDAGFFDARRFLIRALRSGSCRAQPTAANLQSASGLLTSAPIFLYEAERRPAGLEARRGTRVHDRVTGGEREREKRYKARQRKISTARPRGNANKWSVGFPHFIRNKKNSLWCVAQSNQTRIHLGLAIRNYPPQHNSTRTRGTKQPPQTAV